MMEIWKDVHGYEGIYQVSNLGRVRRILHAPGMQTGLLSLQKLKSAENVYYLSVGLSYNGEVKTYRVHRLVAKAFLDIDDNLEVNHIDGNRFNNELSNLEVCDRSHNAKHAFRYLGRKPHIENGEERYNAKLTDEIVRYIRGHERKYGIATKLAKELGVHHTVVSKVLNGIAWKHVDDKVLPIEDIVF